MKYICQVLKYWIIITFIILTNLSGEVLSQIDNNDNLVHGVVLCVDLNGNYEYYSINTAIRVAEPGDTILVRPGEYNEDIKIDKPLKLLGQDKEKTIIYAENSKGIYITSDSVEVSGFTITGEKNPDNRYDGIYISDSNDVLIKNNIIRDVEWGIIITDSNRITIMNNECRNCLESLKVGRSTSNIIRDNIFENVVGFQQNCNYNIISNNQCLSQDFLLYESNFNTITNNKINGQLRLHDSHGNTVHHNQIMEGLTLRRSDSNSFWENSMNNTGLIFSGNTIEKWLSNSIHPNNTVKGKPILYWAGESNQTIPSDVAQVILVDCKNIIIENLTFSDVSTGISVGYSSNIIIRNNTFLSLQRVYDGSISIFYSNNNTISNNSVNNSVYGLTCSSSENNTIENNNFSHIVEEGIYLSGSDWNTVKNNKILNCSFNGLLLSESKHNQIINNTLKGDPYLSIYSFGWYNHFINNTIISNTVGRGDLAIYGYGGSFKNNIMFNCGLTSDYWDYFRYEDSQNQLNIKFEKNTVNGKPVVYWRDVSERTIPPGAGQIVLINCSKVIIEDQNCSNTSSGIILGNSENIIIRDNECSNNSEGISIFYSKNNKIYDNNLNNNNKGISCYYSDSNSIISNHINEHKYHGIYLFMSENNRIHENEMKSCGIDVFSGYDRQFLENEIGINNTVNGRPIYFWVNKNDKEVPPGSGQVYLRNCSNITIKGQDLGNCYGIFVRECIGVKIISNIISSNNRGIDIEYSFSIIIMNNSISNNEFGIEISWTNDTKIINNNISNNYYGISVGNSHKNLIEGNFIANNTCGIFLRYSDNNRLMKNSFKNNNICINFNHNCRSNIIIRNNFISNDQHFMDGGLETRWHYYGEGNYWSDYSGEDCGGVSGIQGDHIGDTKLPAHDVDPYPYTEPNGWEKTFNQTKVSNADEPDYGDLDNAVASGGFDWACNSIWIIAIIMFIIMLLVLVRRKRKKSAQLGS